MKIIFPITTLELSEDEAVELYCCVKRGLEYTIDSHWVNHPASYEQLEQRRLSMLSTLNRSVGYDIDPLKQLRERLDAAVKAKGENK